jgi:hypothetical protein
MLNRPEIGGISPEAAVVDQRIAVLGRAVTFVTAIADQQPRAAETVS